jgi:hypothetical protein
MWEAELRSPTKAHPATLAVARAVTGGPGEPGDGGGGLGDGQGVGGRGSEQAHYNADTEAVLQAEGACWDAAQAEGRACHRAMEEAHSRDWESILVMDKTLHCLKAYTAQCRARQEREVYVSWLRSDGDGR